MLTPTQQGVLSKALMDVIMARNSGETELYWTCLGTLYLVHPEKGIKELDAKLNPIFNKLEETDVIGHNYTATRRNADQSLFYYKKANNDKIFKIIMTSLRDNGYAEIVLGAKPIYERKGHLNVPTTT
jgi:hypothetical protein